MCSLLLRIPRPYRQPGRRNRNEMLPGSRLRLLIMRQVHRIGKMANDEAMCDKAVDDGTQCVAILSRRRNSFARVLAVIIHPVLIVVGDFSPIDIWML